MGLKLLDTEINNSDAEGGRDDTYLTDLIGDIGGSYAALELDAKRAIDQGTRLAAVIETAKTGDVFEAPDTSNKLTKLLTSLIKK